MVDTEGRLRVDKKRDEDRLWRYFKVGDKRLRTD